MFMIVNFGSNPNTRLSNMTDVVIITALLYFLKNLTAATGAAARCRFFCINCYTVDARGTLIKFA